jgi:hypothetical protein
MNGRIYDPELGRMLSPDPVVQVPEYSQNFNRYSYVMNNPLNLTDPSGFSWLGKAFHRIGGWLKENWRTLAVIAVVAIVTWGAGLAFSGAGAIFTAGGIPGGTLSAVGISATGAVAGAVGGGLNAGFAGGDLGDILRGAAIGAIQGAITGGMGNGALNAFNAGNYLMAAAYITGHGLVGGAVNEAMGGKFQDGFLSAAVSAAAMMIPFGNSDPIGGLIKSSTVGGTASAVGGGKFANGAYMGAFQYLVSPQGVGAGKNLLNGIGKGLGTLSRSPLGYLWNLPNTAVGLALGGMGFVAEAISFPFTRKWDFSVSIDHNAIQFTGHNFVGTAITIGNSISYHTTRQNQRRLNKWRIEV